MQENGNILSIIRTRGITLTRDKFASSIQMKVPSRWHDKIRCPSIFTLHINMRPYATRQVSCYHIPPVGKCIHNEHLFRNFCLMLELDTVCYMTVYRTKGLVLRSRDNFVIFTACLSGYSSFPEVGYFSN